MRNFIKFYIANFKRSLLNNLLNIICLTIGISGFVLLYSYTKHELSYEYQTPNSRNIYRVVTDVMQQEGMMQTNLSSSYIAKTVAPSIPEVINTARITPSIETFLTIDDRSFYQDGTWYADSSFFKVFKFPLMQGKPSEVLDKPFSIVLSESLSKKYFGNKNPVGEQIRVGDRWNYTVSGIMKDIPTNFHLDVSLIMTADSINAFSRVMPGALALYTYLEAAKGVEKDTLSHKLMKFFEEDYGEKWLELVKFDLQPIGDIHLKSDRLHEFAKTADPKQINLLVVIAILILAISVANYINIMTARSEYRSREASIRKVSGAGNTRLLMQFYLESLLNTLLASIISICTTYYIWPSFVNFIEVELVFPLIEELHWFILFVVCLALLSGSYPAIMFSRIKPLIGMQGYISNKKNGISIRKVLVIGQFALAVFVVFSTIVIYLQMEFVQERDKGLDNRNIAILTLRDAQMLEQMDYFRNRLLEIPDIEEVSAGGSKITNIYSGQRSYALKDSSADYTGADFMIRTTHIDEHFIPMHKIEMIAGRNFNPSNATDTAVAAIINEAAAKSIGVDNPVGVELNDNNRQRTIKIVGLVKDFQYQSMHQKVEPIIFRYHDENLPFMYIKFNNLTTEAIKEVETIWSELTGVYPFQMQYLEEEFAAMHNQESKMRALYLFFTLLALIIASLGLYGLTSYITEKRTKEIGIRKVLGAKTKAVFYTLSQNYFVWVFIANVASLPFAYLAMKKWLQSFAFISGIHWWIFLLTMVITVCVAFLTILLVLLKAVRLKPIACLRHE